MQQYSIGSIESILSHVTEQDGEGAIHQYEAMLRPSQHMVDLDLSRRYLASLNSMLLYAIAGSHDFLLNQRMLTLYRSFLLELNRSKLIQEANDSASRYFQSLLPELLQNCVKSLELRTSGKVIRYIKSRYPEIDTIETIAEELSINARTFSAKVKRESGQSVRQLLGQVRLTLAAEKLISTHRSELEVALSVGYQDLQAFRKAFKALFHMTPYSYRRSMEQITG